MQIGTGDATIELVLKSSTTPNVNNNVGVFTLGNESSGLALAIISGVWRVSFAGAGGAEMGPVQAGVKQHVALSGVGGQWRLFIDGEQLGPTLTNNINLSQNTLKIGYYYSPSFAITCVIDEFRFTKGVGRYVENFTPPLFPLPDP
jgi:hypothetical protein